MKVLRKIFIVLFLTMLTACFFLSDLTDKPVWTQKTADTAPTVSSIEREILAELNYARQNPRGYAKNVLQPRIARFNGLYYRQDDGVNLKTQEGARAVQEAVQELNSRSALQPLALDTALSKASRLLAEYQAQSGTIGHSGPNGMNMQQRIERYGSWDGYIGENCAYGSKTAREIVAELIIDDGVSGRGHRKNIFNGRFNKVGIAYIEGGNAPYGSVCVMDFAGSFTAK